jgi:hypothetical protein
MIQVWSTHELTEGTGGVGELELGTRPDRIEGIGESSDDSNLRTSVLANQLAMLA